MVAYSDMARRCRPPEQLPFRRRVARARYPYFVRFDGDGEWCAFREARADALKAGNVQQTRIVREQLGVPPADVRRGA